jgi:hypothetical protein
VRPTPKINGLAVKVQSEYEQWTFPWRGGSLTPANCRDQSQSREHTAMTGNVTALLNTLTRSDVEAMTPAERRRFAELCRHWAGLAERARIDPRGSGVLADLRQGHHTD